MSLISSGKKSAVGWALFAALTACSGDSAGGASFDTATVDPAVPATLNFPLQQPTPGAMRLVQPFPNLRFPNAVQITHSPDGTDRLFVVQQGGQISVFHNRDGEGSATVFLDLGNRIIAGAELGLLGLAFAPDYRTSGLFYVNYTASSPRRTVVSEFRVSSDPDVADPQSERIVLTFQQPLSTHNGGMLAFGPDGMLYISSGDGGGSGDPNNRAQDLGVLHGKILRIHPSGAIPPDNPLAEMRGVRHEIYAWGLRNPWRFSFDRQTGDLWCGDVGQDAVEEIDLILPGRNYGWRLFEGSRNFNNPTGINPRLYESPIYEYDHSVGESITGGYVYRGTEFTELRGAYIYGDFKNGNIWALVYDGTEVVSNTHLAVLTSITSFGEDEAGELLMVDINGTVNRLARQQGGGGPFPTKLSDTGLFEDAASLSPAAGVIAYDINSPLWSDGAIKQRWLYVPALRSLEFSARDTWRFPVGSVLVKHFELELQVGDAQSRRRLETRVLVNEEAGWAGYTYKWNSAQTDAVLLPGSATETFTVLDPRAPGGQRQQTWYYPSRTDCRSCHTGARDSILGLRTGQMNKIVTNSSGPYDQLRLLEAHQLFASPLGPGPFIRYADPSDQAALLEDRARSYLAANCSSCHLPSGPTRVALDLRWRTPLAQTGTVGAFPQQGTLGLIDPRIILNGDKSRSVLWERLRRLDQHRMPPLGTSELDPLAIDIIGRWIDQL